MSNRPFQSTENQQSETTSNPNKVVSDLPNATTTTTSTKRKSVDEDYANEPKVIRIDGQDLVNLTKSKKLILSRPTANNSSPKATATSTVTVST